MALKDYWLTFSKQMELLGIEQPKPLIQKTGYFIDYQSGIQNIMVQILSICLKPK